MPTGAHGAGTVKGGTVTVPAATLVPSRYVANSAWASPLEFLELLLQGEIDRRDSHGLTRRLEAAGFDELVTYEQLVWDTPVSYDRPRVRDLFGLH